MRVLFVCCIGWLRIEGKRCVQEAPSSWSKHEKAALCSAESSGAAQCAKAMGNKLRRETRIALCRDAQSLESAQCALEALKYFENEADVVALCREGTTATANCVSAAVKKKKSSTSILLALCEDAESEVPGQCYHAVAMHDANAVTLCKNAVDKGPEKCARAASGKKQLSNEALVATLCHGALLEYATAPAECYDRARRGHVPSDGALSICLGVRDPTQIADCARKFTKDHLKATKQEPEAQALVEKCRTQPLAATIETTRKTSAKTNLECHAYARKAHLPKQLLDALCSQGTASAGSCVSQAPYAMRPASKVALCDSTKKEDEARGRSLCATLALRNGEAHDFAAALCRNAYNESPAKCAAAMRQQWKNQDDRLALCAYGGTVAAECAIEVATSFRRAGRTAAPQYIAALCRGATSPQISQAVAECSIAVTGGGRLRLEDTEMQRLCAATVGSSQRLALGVLAAKQCFLDIGNTLPSTERAVVCQDTGSEKEDGAAACVLALRRLSRKYSDKEVVAICKGANDTSPAHCAARLGNQNNFMQCRGVRAVASALEFIDHDYEGKSEGRPLRPRQNFITRLQVLDQYGQPTTETTSAIASIPLENSQGAVLEGLRTNSSHHGILTFHTLRLSQAGNFSLRFRLSSDTAHSAAITLRVGNKEDQYTSPAGRCGALLISMLRCLPDQHDNTASATTTVAATLPAETLISGKLAGCRSRLEEAGFSFALGWNRDTWVYYRQALAWIEASFYPSAAHDKTTTKNHFLPAAHLSATERLGVPPESDSRTIRKAYHKLSLDWHPDRWLAFPLYTSLVQSLFADIGDAYRLLQIQQHVSNRDAPQHNKQHQQSANASSHQR